MATPGKKNLKKRPAKKRAARKARVTKAVVKKRGKKTPEAAEPTVVCTYSKRIGDAPPPPTVETHGPVVESEDGKKELQPV